MTEPRVRVEAVEIGVEMEYNASRTHAYQLADVSDRRDIDNQYCAKSSSSALVGENSILNPGACENHEEEGCRSANADIQQEPQPTNPPFATRVLIFIASCFFLHGVITDGTRQIIPSFTFACGPPASQSMFYFTQVGKYPTCSDERASQLWRLWTSAFIHGGIVHFLSNAVMLYMFGPLYEEVCRIRIRPRPSTQTEAGRGARTGKERGDDVVISGAWSLIAIAFLTVPIANICAAVDMPYLAVVGMSGLVYGLLGALLSRCLSPSFSFSFSSLPSCNWLCAAAEEAEVETKTRTLEPLSDMNRKLVLVSLVCMALWDVSSYLFFKQASLSYTSHMCGFVAGFLADTGFGLAIHAFAWTCPANRNLSGMPSGSASASAGTSAGVSCSNCNRVDLYPLLGAFFLAAAALSTVIAVYVCTSSPSSLATALLDYPARYPAAAAASCCEEKALAGLAATAAATTWQDPKDAGAAAFLSSAAAAANWTDDMCSEQ